MTNKKATKSSFIKQLSTGLAFAAAPFAMAFGIAGIAAIDAPAANAQYYYYYGGDSGYYVTPRGNGRYSVYQMY